MNLTELHRSWNTLAAKDAMWAVLTGPFGTNRAWDPEAFFSTGVAEIEQVLNRVAALHAPLHLERALDFGCGVGRLTQALGQRFHRVDGVDIAEVMIREARSLNRLGDRCHYHLNEADNLSVFADGSFDFVYSSITLQHMEPQYSRRYIKEFFRVLRPGGIASFQIPGEPVAVPRKRTRNSAPLPRAACRATIDAPATLRCAPDALLPLRIRVRNDGTQTWYWMGEEDDGRYAVRLGNHWRHRFGWVTRQDDGRTELPYDIEPGASLEIAISPRAPHTPGIHVLEFDMVQELVRWFAKAGSRTARTRVHVDPLLRPGEVEGIPAVIEMHGIPRSDVETLIVDCSSVVLAVDDNDAPGAGWTSYRYFGLAS
jgi:SAM-dependent methyltransferase